MDKHEIQTSIRHLQDQLFEIERAERREANAKLLGKCFVYRNCYSCPQDEADYWPMYSRVVHLTDDGNMRVLSFQTDSNGKVEIEERIASSQITLGLPITARQFDAAWKRLLKKIQSL